MSEGAFTEQEFSLRKRLEGNTVVLEVRGEADLHTAPELRATLTDVIDDGARRVVVDLTATTFIDSMTLGVLLGTLKRLQPSGGRMAIACPDEHVRRVFEITSLQEILNVHASTDAALAAASADA